MVNKSEVFLIKTSDRNLGIRSLLERFDLNNFNRKRVALKPNFNSADPFPASTHIDTLETIVNVLKESGVERLTVAERSGMGKTRDVLKKMGVFNLSDELGFDVVVLDEEGVDGWVKIGPDGTHWSRGFYISKLFLSADKVVQTCCLKTHRFGGHFTMSLKNSTGLVASQVPSESYNYMSELHSSPNQRLMIAEINQTYKVDLVVMDAIKAFASGGPDRGDIVEPNLLLASRDRIAIDAVGVAILRKYGTTKEITKGAIFKLEQIRRAAELGVGVKSADDIKLIPLNDISLEAANDIERILKI
nr:DUF362 domain-containing protein [Candidatus Freyarchaeota archaeon]